MRTVLFAAFISAALPLAAQAPAGIISSAQAQLPALTQTYRYLHSHPELSRHEEQTASFFAAQLRPLGYTVTEHVGKYTDGAPAFGVVAVLANGSGPRVLLRTELDALPVEEKTGLPFASTVKTTNAQGQSISVMHACGHDLHMTALLGAARELAQRKSQWHGTVIIIGQPAEEMVQGASAMLADGLYERFGRPDFILSEHDWNGIPADSVAIKGGPLLAGVTSINMTIRGIGGHGSAPQAGKDPIVLAAEFILVAQTIVSRQIDPQQPAVLTVGTIHGGTKNNIIPDEVTLGMTLRTYSSAVQDQIVAAVRRTANGLAAAYGIPADRMPIITTDEGSPATINDAALATRLRAPLEAALGKEHILDATAVMASEDVGAFTLGGKIPGVMIWLGAGDPAKIAESQKTGIPLPSPHSPLFAPDANRAIPTGITAMTTMALSLLQ
ncbi:MAG: amidohydrolase [Terracidiphilus sp.]|nr:amidohydrolase [Terracidiphilus sp.]